MQRVTRIALVLLMAYCPTRPAKAVALADELSDRTKWLPMEDSMKWCGARSLWLAAQYYGIDCEFEQLLEECKPDAHGFSALSSIARSAERLGLRTRLVECSDMALKACSIPAITVHRTSKGKLHAQLMLDFREVT